MRKPKKTPEIERLRKIAKTCQTPKEFLDRALGADLIFVVSVCRERFSLTNDAVYRVVTEWESIK